jgi:hypothetical protein
MEKNFMISFRFGGRTIYANVFEYRHSPAVYDVHFIDHVVPAKITLHEQDGHIVPDPATEESNSELVKQAIEAIKRNPSRI